MASRRGSGDGGGGGNSGDDNFIYMLAGMVGAAIYDYFMLGYLNKPMAYVVRGSKRTPVTIGDNVQILTSVVLGMHGLSKRKSRLPAFAFGMAITQIGTKFVFPSFGVKRYLVADVDALGRLVRGPI